MSVDIREIELQININTIAVFAAIVILIVFLAYDVRRGNVSPESFDDLQMRVAKLEQSCGVATQSSAVTNDYLSTEEAEHWGNSL